MNVHAQYTFDANRNMVDFKGHTYNFDLDPDGTNTHQ